MIEYNLGFFINRETQSLEFYKVNTDSTDTLNQFTVQPVEDTTIFILNIPVGRLFDSNDINTTQESIIANAMEINNSILSPIQYLNSVLILSISNGNLKELSTNISIVTGLMDWYYTAIDDRKILHTEDN